MFRNSFPAPAGEMIETGSKMQKAGVNRGPGMTRRLFVCLAVLCTVFVASCRQDMQDQPKYKAYRAAPGGGTSMRVAPQGTVARGFLRADTELYTGKMAQTGATTDAAGQPAQPANVTTFPFPITDEVMARGQERYQIYCSVCHGLTGAGDGMIVRRGYRTPPAFTEQRAIDAPVGHYFDVITNGWGAMPSYASQIPVQDRWAIIAYVRALQRSQGGSAGTGTATSGTGANNANASNANANSAPAASPAQNQAGGHE